MLMNFKQIKQTKEKIKQLLMAKLTANLFFIVILLLLLFMCLHQIFAPTQAIASFDFKATYAAFLKEAANSHISQDKIAILGKRFPEALSNALNIYSDKHHAAIFVSQAVMAGAIDATPEIQSLIAAEMKKLAEAANNRDNKYTAKENTK